MQVVNVGGYTDEDKFSQAIYSVIENFDYENVEIKYSTCCDENNLFFSALIIIKDTR
jgi:hypothetical protein